MPSFASASIANVNVSQNTAILRPLKYVINPHNLPIWDQVRSDLYYPFLSLYQVTKMRIVHHHHKIRVIWLILQFMPDKWKARVNHRLPGVSPWIRLLKINILLAIFH